MKIALSMLALALVAVSSSCRTSMPLDPMTMKQSCRCLPGNFTYGHVCGESTTVTVTK